MNHTTNNIFNPPHRPGCRCLECARHNDLMNRWRSLWSKHIMWLRLFIISKVHNLDDIDIVTKRLMFSPRHIGSELRGFYSKRDINIFIQLFEIHLGLFSELVDALIQKNQDLINTTRRKLILNANEIISHLHMLFPTESKRVWKYVIYKHMELLEKEVIFRVNKKYKKNNSIYNEIQQTTDDIADMIGNSMLIKFF